jgi:hypothetical protein
MSETPISPLRRMIGDISLPNFGETSERPHPSR